jgi:hypothetical protein
MLVRATKQAVLDGCVIEPGDVFEFDAPPPEWFGVRGWLQPFHSSERVPRRSSEPFVNSLHPHNLVTPIPPRDDDDYPPEAA